jgi:hypothetical protein
LRRPRHPPQPFLDSFTVELNGTTLFQDDFADGVVPPAAPDFLFPEADAVSYSTLGTMFESGGKVRGNELPDCCGKPILTAEFSNDCHQEAENSQTVI